MSQEVTQQVAGLPAQAGGQLLMKATIKVVPEAGSVMAGVAISIVGAPAIVPAIVAVGAASALTLGGYGIYRYFSGTGRKALPPRE